MTSSGSASSQKSGLRQEGGARYSLDEEAPRQSLDFSETHQRERIFEQIVSLIDPNDFTKEHFSGVAYPKKMAQLLSVIPDLEQDESLRSERSRTLCRLAAFCLMESREENGEDPTFASFRWYNSWRNRRKRLAIGSHLVKELRSIYRPYDGFFARAVSGYPPSVKVVFGTFGAIFLIMSIAFALWVLGIIHQGVVTFVDDIVGNAPLFFGCVLLGAVGGLISLWARIGKFATEEIKSSDHDKDPFALIFTGLVKPFVGAAFAVFAYCVVNSDILPIRMDDPNAKNPFLLAVAFLAGFSERFVSDLVSRTQQNSDPSSIA